MRVYRNGIKICLFLCLGSVALLLADQFDIPSKIEHLCWLVQHSSTLIRFINNVLLGALASAFVVLLTYVGAYNIEKKKIIGLTIYYCSKYVIELSNLIPQLIKINNDGHCKYNWPEVKEKVETDRNIHLLIEKLDNLHNERLLCIEGYYPLLRKRKKNLDVHHLLCFLAKVNGAVQYCDIAYKFRNNMVYKMERRDFSYTEPELRKQVEIILQIDNDVYQKFLKLLEIVKKRSKAMTVYSSNWEGKCS